MYDEKIKITSVTKPKHMPCKTMTEQDDGLNGIHWLLSKENSEELLGP